MTFDPTIPLWGLLTVLCGAMVKLLDRYCIELAEAVIKFLARLMTLGLSREAKLLWRRELLIHQVERISEDLNSGRSRRNVAWLAIWEAMGIATAAPSLRTDYARRADSGENAEEIAAPRTKTTVRSRVVALERSVNHLRVVSPLMMLIAVLGLAAVFVPGLGVETHGATRWIGTPSFAVQPGDFAKLAVPIYLSAWMSSRAEGVRVFWLGMFPCAVLVGIVVGLLILEPDLASAVVIAFTVMAITFVAGATTREFAWFNCTAFLAALALLGTQGQLSVDLHGATSPVVSFVAAVLFAMSIALVLAVPLALIRLKLRRSPGWRPFGPLMAISMVIWVCYEIAFNIGWAIHFIPNDNVYPQLSIARIPNVALMTLAIVLACCIAVSRIARKNQA